MECAIGTSSLDPSRVKAFEASKANTMEDCTPSNYTQSVLKGDGWILGERTCQTHGWCKTMKTKEPSTPARANEKVSQALLNIEVKPNPGHGDLQPRK